MKIILEDTQGTLQIVRGSSGQGVLISSGRGIAKPPLDNVFAGISLLETLGEAIRAHGDQEVTGMLFDLAHKKGEGS